MDLIPNISSEIWNAMLVSIESNKIGETLLTSSSLQLINKPDAKQMQAELVVGSDITKKEKCSLGVFDWKKSY